VSTLDSRRPAPNNYNAERKKIEKKVSKTLATIEGLLLAGMLAGEASNEEATASSLLLLEALRRSIKTDTEKVLTQSFIEGKSQQIIAVFDSIGTAKRAKEYAKSDATDTESTVLREVAQMKLDGEKLTRTTAKKIALKAEEADSTHFLLSDKKELVVKSLDEAITQTMKSVETLSLAVEADRLEMRNLEARPSLAEDEAKRLSDIQEKLEEKGLAKRIQKEAFVAKTDAAGRNLKLANQTRTTLISSIHESYLNGMQEEATRLNMDLAIISSHGAKDECSLWEGVVISMNGETKGYPTLEDAKKSKQIFHPNCQHSVHSIRSLDMLADDDIKKHKEKSAKLSY